MFWTQNNYPTSTNNLRTPAIEVANDLSEDGYDNRAAMMSQSKKRANTHREGSDRDLLAQDVRVVPHPDGWAVTRTNAEKASFVFDNIAAAQNKALQISREDRVGVLIHGADGQLRIALGRVSTVNA